MKYTSNTIKIHPIFICIVLAVFCSFFVKLCYVSLNQVVEGTDLVEESKKTTIAKKVIKADRGRIYDNAGNLLAQNVNSYTLIAYLDPERTEHEDKPRHVVDKELTATKLSEILTTPTREVKKEYILKLLNQEGLYQTEFGVAGKGLTENVKQRIEALDLPGLDFVKTSRRYYQNADFASYIIGYAKKKENSEELVGELGVEGYCNRYLKGKDGSITYQQDAQHNPLPDTEIYEERATDGYDVYLTLDKQVQIFLDNAVEEFKKYNPAWVTLTIAKADTGAIIGSSTTPSFDPNKLNIENYNNPLTSYTYEPGSTMKIFSFASAIEEGKYKGDELYQSGTIDISDYTIKDWNKTGWGKITYDVGFTYSSNIAAVNLGLKRLGKKKLADYYDKLGFGSLTGIELSGELKGDMGFEYDVEVASASYGQGVTVTPVQMVQALTSLTNDGTVLKPYIIDKIIDPNTNKVVYQGKRTEKNKVYSTSTVNKMIELMDATVNGSDTAATGKVYSTPAVRLIGKTGTANYTGPNGKYVTGSYKNIRSFAGVFPKEEPEYIIYVAVKDFEGSSKNMGGIIKSMVESIAKYRNIDERPSDKDESKVVKVGNYLNTPVHVSESKIASLGVQSIVIGNGSKVIGQYPKKNVKTSQKSKIFLVTNGDEIVMPNIIGWSSSEVISLCNLIKIPYELNGYGYVQSTNILAGDIIDLDTTKLVVDLANINADGLTN